MGSRMLGRNDDRGGSGRSAAVRHRLHRVPRHGARRAAAALRARLRAGPARPARPPRDSRSSGSIGRSSRTTPSTAFGTSSARTASTRWSPRRVQVVAGDVGVDGLGLDDDGPGRARLRATSSSTRPPPCRSTPRSTVPSRSTSSGRPGSSTTLQELGVATPPRRGVHLLRRRQPTGCRPRAAARPEPVLHPRPLAERGRRRPPRPRRRRGREPHPGDAGRLPQGSPRRAGRGRHARCSPRRPSSAAAGG